MIKFYSFIPELTEQVPIEKARINNFQWYQNMVDDYHNETPKPKSHTSRCPGILSVCSYGWVQRVCQDFKITTNGDGESFRWDCSVDHTMLKYGDYMSDYIHYHPFPQLFKFNEFKKNTLKTIIKVQSPWVVEIPDGYFLLSMPIPYNDNNNFTAAHGLLTGFSSMNVQIFWHSLNEEVYIKKGTPLCQYILIKKEDVDYSVEVANDLVYSKMIEKEQQIFFNKK